MEANDRIFLFKTIVKSLGYRTEPMGCFGGVKALNEESQTIAGVHDWGGVFLYSDCPLEHKLKILEYIMEGERDEQA